MSTQEYPERNLPEPSKTSEEMKMQLEIWGRLISSARRLPTYLKDDSTDDAEIWRYRDNFKEPTMTLQECISMRKEQIPFELRSEHFRRKKGHTLPVIDFLEQSSINELEEIENQEGEDEAVEEIYTEEEKDIYEDEEEEEEEMDMMGQAFEGEDEKEGEDRGASYI